MSYWSVIGEYELEAGNFVLYLVFVFQLVVMLENIDLQNIRNIRWYRQGGAGRALYFFVPFQEAMKICGQGNEVLQMIGNMHHNYFNIDRELAACLADIENQKKDKTYIDKMIGEWETFLVQLKKLQNKIDGEDLSGLENRQLVELYSEMIEIEHNLWRIAVHIEMFDPWADKVVNDELRGSGLNINFEDLNFFLSANGLSISQQEELDLFKIILDQSGDRESLLENHQHKYFWITNDWADVIDLDKEYFRGKLGQFMELGREEIEKRVLEMETFAEMKKMEKEKLKNKYNLPENLDNIFYFFSRMTYWRDERKKEVQINNIYYHRFAEEFSRRTGVDFDHISFLMPEEVKETKLNFSAELEKSLKQRAESCIYYLDKKGKYVALVGEEYQTFFQILNEAYRGQFTELKGIPVCHGQARAKVKIINTREDFSKMQAGDILVAPMTRPEYLPLIKIAGAIITDEGGVTCHAAIISRELGIPCIIGTQVATEVLQDGDMVEVDAERGIVTKL